MKSFNKVLGTIKKRPTFGGGGKCCALSQLQRRGEARRGEASLHEKAKLTRGCFSERSKASTRASADGTSAPPVDPANETPEESAARCVVRYMTIIPRPIFKGGGLLTRNRRDNSVNLAGTTR